MADTKCQFMIRIQRQTYLIAPFHNASQTSSQFEGLIKGAFLNRFNKNFLFHEKSFSLLFFPLEAERISVPTHRIFSPRMHHCQTQSANTERQLPQISCFEFSLARDSIPREENVRPTRNNQAGVSI